MEILSNNDARAISKHAYMVSHNYCPIRRSNSNELIGQELWETLYVCTYIHTSGILRYVVVYTIYHHQERMGEICGAVSPTFSATPSILSTLPDFGIYKPCDG